MAKTANNLSSCQCAPPLCVLGDPLVRPGLICLFWLLSCHLHKISSNHIKNQNATCLGFICLIQLLQCLSQSTLAHVDEVFTKLPLWSQGIHVQVFQSQHGNLSFGMLWQLVKSKPATVKSNWFFSITLFECVNEYLLP